MVVVQWLFGLLAYKDRASDGSRDSSDRLKLLGEKLVGISLLMWSLAHSDHRVEERPQPEGGYFPHPFG